MPFVRDTRRLLHVVRDHNDSIILFQFHRKVFYLGSGDWVKGAGRFVHQQHLRLHSQRACNAQSLLLSAGKPQRAFLQSVFKLVPNGGVS